MIKIAICDDNEKELNNTRTMCLAYAAEIPEVDILLETFQTPTALLNKISCEKEQYDILLLDVYMPEMTGTELASKLRENNDQVQIIFLTTSVNHAIEAFSLHAVHYLVKPYTNSQLGDALRKALATIEKINKANLILKTTTGMQKVYFSEILYCETEKHFQNIYLMKGKRLQVRITCSELYDLIAGDDRFYKCGSTYIVNLGLIEEVTAKYIVFDNGQQIPMQRRQYKELLDHYTRYSLEN